MERTGTIGQEMPALPRCNEASSKELHYIAEYRVDLKLVDGFPTKERRSSGTAERVGFEPTRRVNPAHAISNRAP
jgi:hypothetical protein